VRYRNVKWSVAAIVLSLFAVGSLILFRPTASNAPLTREVTNSVNMKFVSIPSGKFLMGSPREERRRPDEAQHEVEITKPFLLGIHKVTQDQYKQVMDKNPSYFSDSGEGKDRVKGLDTRRFPVENVSWMDAQDFCEKLSKLPEEKKNGRSYRLPTEAEWEYACRGGAILSEPFHFGHSLSSRQANFDGNHPYGEAPRGEYLQRTSEVGSYPANAFGLFDMHGNVWEWCQDWYAPYDLAIRKDPSGPANSSEDRRVLRGGSWGDHGYDCRSAYRFHCGPRDNNEYHGFRVICVARTS
jgi:formylglycine-generating enzyme required for sulfatase activity